MAMQRVLTTISKLIYRETKKITELINNVRNRYLTQVTNSLRSSEEEHKVNALALGADEGRGKLR